jgi:predicted nucleic acid-binding protein
VAAQWILPEPHSVQAIALSDDAGRNGERLVGPLLLPIEMTNLIWKHVTRNRLGISDALRLLSDFRTYPVTITEPNDLAERALVIADAHRLPATYDAYYVGLAQSLGCDLWTDDQALLRLLAGKLPFVKWIGAY